MFNVHKVLVLIGPEGGFTDEEILGLKKTGAKVVSLGQSILRSNTAALHVLSVLKYLFEK